MPAGLLNKWCEGGRTRLPERERTEPREAQIRYIRPKHVRCPVCNRRLIPQTINHEPWAPPNCFEPGYIVPPHKAKRRGHG